MYASEIVPNSAIVCMAIEMILAFVIPITAVIVWKIKTKASIIPVVAGALTFFIFVQVLEGLAHSVLLFSKNPFSDMLNSNFMLYALYGGLMAGLFEEVGRFLSMKFVLKNYRDEHDAVSFGLGHGGFECMMVLGVNMAVYILLSFLANSGMDYSFLLTKPGSKEIVENLLASFQTITLVMAFVAVFERICAMALHVCLSAVVFAGVRRSSFKYVLAAILLHALADFGILVTMQYAGALVAEAVLALGVGALAYHIFKVKRGCL